MKIIYIGLKDYNDKLGIANFYCVENQATKSDSTIDFVEYCKLRDGNNHFYIYKNCSRKWMNMEDEERGSSGINILWPDTSNKFFKDELEKVKNGESPNNISPIITYSLKNGITAMWMGDLETNYLNNVKDNINFSKIDILFAPHHGRESGKVPEDILEKLNPKIVIIGEAPSENINYYSKYNTLTQNSAKNIIFRCEEGQVHIYVSSENYSVDFLDNENKSNFDGHKYLGTLNL